MNAVDQVGENVQCSWQNSFLAMLPEIEQRLRHAFRRLDPESIDDATEDGVVHCLLAHKRLMETGRCQSATPSTLAWYAMLHVRRGRRAGCTMNASDPLSRYAQVSKGIKLEPLQTYNTAGDRWIDSLVEDRRSRVVDQVAARMDIRALFATLSKRTRRSP